LRKGIARQFTILISDSILKELAAVLQRPKFKTSEEEIDSIIFALMQSSDVVHTKSQFQIVREDSKDDIIVNTAYDGHADMIVTGDKDLLRLKDFKGIKIITTENLLSLLSNYS
jgi:hypothetical protein